MRYVRSNQRDVGTRVWMCDKAVFVPCSRPSFHPNLNRFIRMDYLFVSEYMMYLYIVVFKPTTPYAILKGYLQNKYENVYRFFKIYYRTPFERDTVACTNIYSDDENRLQ